MDKIDVIIVVDSVEDHNRIVENMACVDLLDIQCHVLTKDVAIASESVPQRFVSALKDEVICIGKREKDLATSFDLPFDDERQQQRRIMLGLDRPKRHKFKKTGHGRRR